MISILILQSVRVEHLHVSSVQMMNVVQIQMNMDVILFGRDIINLGGNNMYNNIDALKVRIHNLQQRDPVGNARIIAKLKRKVRALENK